MSYWVKQSEDTLLPNWLKESLTAKCPVCGSEMENYYNDDKRCTNRRCSNVGCLSFVAAKADFVRKLLKIEGIGYAGCLRDAQLSGATNPFELLKAWGSRPKVTLDLFLRMHCFEGVDSEWERIVQQLNIYTLDELYEQYDGKWKQLLIDNKELIYSNQQYVQLTGKPSYVNSNTPTITYTVMITGTPNGYATKEEFLDTINTVCRGRIKVIHQKTAKMSGVDCLIVEPGSKTTRKVEVATKAGIPKLSSEQFIMALTQKFMEMNSEQS